MSFVRHTGMHILSVKKLVTKFREDKISEREQLPYFLLFLIASYFFADPYAIELMGRASTNVYDMANLLVTILTTVLGTIYCFACSTKFHGNGGFISRYICIGLPVAVQLVLAYVPIFAAILFLSEFIPLLHTYAETEETTFIGVVLYTAWFVIYYVYLGSAIRKSYA